MKKKQFVQKCICFMLVGVGCAISVCTVQASGVLSKQNAYIQQKCDEKGEEEISDISIVEEE